MAYPPTAGWFAARPTNLSLRLKAYNFKIMPALAGLNLGIHSLPASGSSLFLPSSILMADRI